MKNEIIIYKSEYENTQVEVKLDSDTVWLSLNQMTKLFNRDKSVISRHINNVFKENELDRFSLKTDKSNPNRQLERQELL